MTPSGRRQNDHPYCRPLNRPLKRQSDLPAVMPRQDPRVHIPAIVRLAYRTILAATRCQCASTLLLAVLGLGAAFSLTSMTVALIAAQVLFGDRHRTAGAVLVYAAPVVGSAVGGWWVQPRLDRLLGCDAHDESWRHGSGQQ
jgi:hypothetical protein